MKARLLQRKHLLQRLKYNLYFYKCLYGFNNYEEIILVYLPKTATSPPIFEAAVIADKDPACNSPLPLTSARTNEDAARRLQICATLNILNYFLFQKSGIFVCILKLKKK